MSISQLDAVKEKWLSQWDAAQLLWSPFVRLKTPDFLLTEQEEKKAGTDSAIALIRLTDHQVVISLNKIAGFKLEDYPLEIMGHEIGHHVYCPADLTDLGKLTARIKKALPTRESMTPFINNLYSDMLINDRLFREHHLQMDKVYEQFKSPEDPLWNLIMRAYEILWSLQKGTLTAMTITDEIEADAQIINRLIRSYANDWLKGAGRFAMVCLSYLINTGKPLSGSFNAFNDALSPHDGQTIPDGLLEIDDDETAPANYPTDKEQAGKPGKVKSSNTGQNYREPFEYGQLLKSMGINLSDEEIAIRYYRERSIPYLIPFPVKESQTSKDPIPESLDLWDIGSPLEQINWFESIVRSPYIVPGYTTLEQTYGIDQGKEKEKEPVDLDIYVDSSGSMPDPRVNISWLTLAGAIICISALRSGSRVQATLWSGTREFLTTPGFIRDEKKILSILTGFFGGGTAFPIHILRDTYENRKKTARKVHILVISDEGVDTMFSKDEKGHDGKSISRMSLEKCGMGGTFALNLYSSTLPKPLEFAQSIGWDIYRIQKWEDLIRFSKEFTRKHYAEKNKV